MSKLQQVVVPGPGLLKNAKVTNPKACVIEPDKTLKELVLCMKGEPTLTRVQVPKEDRPLSSLHLMSTLVTLQVNLNSVDHFGLEVVVNQSAVQRTRLIIGTHIKEAKHELAISGIPTARLPLIIPRNKWVQVVFHIGGIVDNLFGMAPMKSIDSISLCGTAKIGRLMASSDEQACIDSTPPGIALFAVPAYAPPIWVTSSPQGGEAAAAGSGSAAAKGTATISSPSAPGKLAANTIGVHGHAVGSSSTSAVASGLLQGSSPGSVSPLQSRGTLPVRLKPLTVGSSNSHGATPREGVEADRGQGCAPHEEKSQSGPSTTKSPEIAHLVDFGSPRSTSARASLAHRQNVLINNYNNPVGLCRSSPLNHKRVAYMRLFDEELHPVQPRQTNTGAAPPRRQLDGAAACHQGSAAAGTTPAVGDATDEISGWDCDDRPSSVPVDSSGGGASAPSAARQPKEKAEGRPARSQSKPKSQQDERVQRLIAARKRRVEPPGNARRGGRQCGSANGEDSENGGANPVSRRRNRARRRMQILRRNEQKNAKVAIAKSLHASEIPVTSSIEIVVLDDAAKAEITDVKQHELKYGYGFGYLGVLREDGEYEVDEDANVSLKGALSLELSDDEDEDE